MKYIVHLEIDPDAGFELENNPKLIQDLMAKWQVHKPIGMYFSLTRRTITIILEAANEDTFFEALHATWRAVKEYPDVFPVATADEFPKILARVGIGK